MRWSKSFEGLVGAVARRTRRLAHFPLTFHLTPVWLCSHPSSFCLFCEGKIPQQPSNIGHLTSRSENLSNKFLLLGSSRPADRVAQKRNRVGGMSSCGEGCQCPSRTSSSAAHPPVGGRWVSGQPKPGQQKGRCKRPRSQTACGC